MTTSLEKRALPSSSDRFYGTRAFAVLCLIVLVTVLLLYTWNETEAGEKDPPPRPFPQLSGQIISV